MIDAFSSNWLGQRVRCTASLARSHYAKPLMLASFLALSGCLGSQSDEGRAAAILDASEAPAREHAGALASGDVRASQRTGAALLSILGVWYD